MTLPQIYLGGGKSNAWREWTTERLKRKAICYDPFARSGQESISEFTHDDLRAVRGSSLLLGVVDYPKYTGLALEFGYAYALGIPIIYVHSREVARIDSMMAGVSKAIFGDVVSAVEFIDERYL